MLTFLSSIEFKTFLSISCSVFFFKSTFFLPALIFLFLKLELFGFVFRF